MFNDTQPTFFHTPGRIVVIGDVHGDVSRFLQCLYACNVFNRHFEWIAEPRNTIVVQMGDQIDGLSRGEASAENWEKFCDTDMLYLTDTLDRIARLGGGRVLSLVGNHEIMNVVGDFTYVSSKSQQMLPIERRSQLFKPGGSLARLLARRNVVLKIGGTVFCHAGLLMKHISMVDGQLQLLNDVVRKYLCSRKLSMRETEVFSECILGVDSVLWTRTYADLFQEGSDLNQAKNEIDNVLEEIQAKRIVTGHNTVRNITALMEGKVMFADAGLSRAYGLGPRIQCINIYDPDTVNEQVKAIMIEIKDNSE